MDRCESRSSHISSMDVRNSRNVDSCSSCKSLHFFSALFRFRREAFFNPSCCAVSLIHARLCCSTISLVVAISPSALSFPDIALSSSRVRSELFLEELSKARWSFSFWRCCSLAFLMFCSRSRCSPSLSIFSFSMRSSSMEWVASTLARFDCTRAFSTCRFFFCFSKSSNFFWDAAFADSYLLAKSSSSPCFSFASSIASSVSCLATSFSDFSVCISIWVISAVFSRVSITRCNLAFSFQ
mmetsp:Transcript_2339/g.2484  ORF Transcript_2339/g.2484 Transcript_2339/m.2484 type:complete len:240 (+) Transcript_2339:1534-2253(+)